MTDTPGPWAYAVELISGQAMYRQSGATACDWHTSCYMYFGGSLLFGWVMYLWETYLDLRQHRNFSIKAIPPLLRDTVGHIDQQALQAQSNLQPPAPSHPELSPPPSPPILMPYLQPP